MRELWGREAWLEGSGSTFLLIAFPEVWVDETRCLGLFSLWALPPVPGGISRGGVCDF